MKHLPVALICAASLSACSNTNDLPLAPILEMEYQVEWVGNQALIDRSQITLTLGQDGQASGSAGCNSWFAQYKLKGKSIHFEAPASTRKLCAEALMEQERHFLQSLASTQLWDFNSKGQLRLWPENGQPIVLWPAE